MAVSLPVRRFLLSRRAVDMTFHALYTLTDLRIILRETAPQHELDDKQREQGEMTKT